MQVPFPHSIGFPFTAHMSIVHSGPEVDIMEVILTNILWWNTYEIKWINPIYFLIGMIISIFDLTWEVISTKTGAFIGIIGSCIVYKIFITTHAILATKRIWATFTAWISVANFRWKSCLHTIIVESIETSTSIICGFAEIVTTTMVRAGVRREVINKNSQSSDESFE